MKLIIYFLLTIKIFSLGSFAIEPKLGAKIFLKVDSSQINLENARSYYLEAYYKTSKKIDIGLGSGFEVVEANYTVFNPEHNRRNIKNIPIYLSTKYYLGEDNNVRFYTKGTIGYFIVNSSEIANIYDSRFYTIGLGLDMDNHIVEFNMNATNQIEKDDLIYTSVSYAFIVGYRF